MLYQKNKYHVYIQISTFLVPRGGAPPFCPISQEPDFSLTCGFHQKLVNIMLYHLKGFAEKVNVTILSK